MWKKPNNYVPIAPSQLIPGLFVWLDVKWDEHPFLSNRLLLKTDKEVAIMRSLNLAERLYYCPEKSSCPPQPVVEEEDEDDKPRDVKERARQMAIQAEITNEMFALDAVKKARRKEILALSARADREWTQISGKTREALISLVRSPKMAGKQVVTLSNESTQTIVESDHALAQMLSKKAGRGPYLHPLNVMTLCVLLGNKVGLTGQDLQDLALAALCHDVGKADVAPHVLATSKRKMMDQELYQQHVGFSLDIANTAGTFSPNALRYIAEHHECLDGSGWPAGKKGDEIAQGSRILALVNHYDRLCAPEANDCEPLMPTEGLGHMFKFESKKYDATLLATLIRMLGVYPPGTVVQLNDESLALVIVPGTHSLKPKVLLYEPEGSKQEATILDLQTEAALKIVEAVHPKTLPNEVYDWLEPGQGYLYFHTHDNLPKN